MDSETQIRCIVSRIEKRLQEERHDGGHLPRHTVEALDAVYHALEFVHDPQALASWREAVHERRLSDNARTAMVSMFRYLYDIVEERGQAAASDICDCLAVYLQPELDVGGGPAGGVG